MIIIAPAFNLDLAAHSPAFQAAFDARIGRIMAFTAANEKGKMPKPKFRNNFTEEIRLRQIATRAATQAAKGKVYDAKILEAIKHGCLTVEAISEAVGLTSNTVRVRAANMVEDGRLTSTKVPGPRGNSQKQWLYGIGKGEAE